MQRIQQHDSSGAHKKIITGVKKMERALKPDRLKIDMAALMEAMAEIKEAIDPVWIEYALWEQALRAFEVARRHNDTERKYLAAYDQMIPADQVIEGLVIIIGKALRYIPSGADRSAFASDMRSTLPKRVG